MLNLAVGGELSWPGPTDGSITSATMSIDYVRVYQTSDTVISGVDRTGSAANPNIVGFAGNDHFVLAAGTVSADGGLGVNKAEIATAWTDAKRKPLAGGAWQLTTGLGQMSLTNIAEVNFQGLTIRLGTDKTLVGVGSFGTVFWTDTFAADGSSVVQWYSANRHIEEDLVNAAGIVVRQTLFAQDGSTTILQFTDDGHKTAQRGYSAGALPTYANYYDAGTGRLIQQDGYNSGGARIQTQFFAADGSSIVDKYTAAGVLTEHDVINAAGIYISAKVIAGDGSYTLTLRNATGAVTDRGLYRRRQAHLSQQLQRHHRPVARAGWV